MPILIDEIVAEVEPSVTASAESSALTQMLPIAAPELSALELIELAQQRMQRLIVD